MLPGKRIAAICVGIALVSIGTTLPAFHKTFIETYAPPKGTDLAKAGCVICHVRQGDPKHNVYGQALKAEMEAQKSDELTAAIIGRLASADTDGDGFANESEIRAGSLPGDAESLPTNQPEPEAAPPTSGVSELFPRHSFHPQIVHFPIALFIFGVLLDLLGFRRGSRNLRQAGFWNMIGGTVCLLGAIPTGFLAAFREGYSMTPGGPVFLHLAIALAGSLMMLAAVLWRRKEPASAGYFAWALLAAVVIGLASHFGGALIYG